MTRLAATLPGYANVARVSEVLHLAPRSVRDLIYTGRMPSVRVGRQHYIKASDLDLERRRRVALPLPRRRAASTTLTPRGHGLQRVPSGGNSARPNADPLLRRQRAAERAALVSRWAHQHGLTSPRVPATVQRVAEPTVCDVCGRLVRTGRMLEMVLADNLRPADRLCLACGRRALLDWADRRRREAAEARRLAESLGEPVAPPEPAAARVA